MFLPTPHLIAGTRPISRTEWPWIAVSGRKAPCGCWTAGLINATEDGSLPPALPAERKLQVVHTAYSAEVAGMDGPFECRSIGGVVFQFFKPHAKRFDFGRAILQSVGNLGRKE
ncbi:hypothetical protein M3Y99_00610200 [Aphelenchoides fujianensis]|nr:hypothetical protein M3Y99_00610200 [Aphelenchoides fujianensis]